MIARSWTARASRSGAAQYVEFFQKVLVPQLSTIEGHRGALVLERASGAEAIEITVLTFWDAMEAVTRFAGNAPDRAVVEPEARAVLTSFDSTVLHHAVVVNEVRGI
jgi:heme-degrading monooxygenase HmoA